MIGKMDKRVILQPPNQVPDGAGGYTTVWTTNNVTVWAEEVKPSYKTLQETGTVVSELNRTLKIRIRSDVRKGWRALMGLKRLEVMHTYNPDRAFTVLVCKDVTR